MISKVTIYSDTDYEGSAKLLDVGRYTASQLGIGDDKVSSVRVPAGMKATLYENSNFTGRTVICIANMPAIGKSANDRISSISIEEIGTPKVIIYADSNFSGWSQELDIGSYGNLAIGNDTLSSIRVPAGFKVTLWEHGLSSGRKMIVTEDRSYVGDTFNDMVSAVVVQQLATPKVIIYTETNYEGEAEELNIGEYSSDPIRNDSLTSLRVPAGLKVTLWENGLRSGNKMICVRDTPDVRPPVNNTTSAIVVEKLGTAKVIVYTGSDFTGWSQELDLGEHSSLAIGNDTLSSVIVPAGLKVTLWENGLRSGKRMVCVSDKSYVGDSADDEISAAVVEKLGALRPIAYTDVDYKGWGWELDAGENRSLAIGNDELSSLLIPPGWRVTIWENGIRSGKKAIFVKNTPAVGYSANDKASAALVEQSSQNGVILYTDSDFAGWGEEFTSEGDFDLGPSIGNDKVSSIVVPAGYKVTLFEDGNCTGKSIVFLEDAAELSSFEDKATSMRIEKMQKAPAPSLTELKQMIEEFGPRYYLHPEESHCPSSVDWFLERAKLKSADGFTWDAKNTELPTWGGDDGLYWLEISNDYRGGDLSTAVAYVNAKYYEYWIDLQFWFFYPYNGAGKAKIKWSNLVQHSSSTINLEPMGQHGGDWEHCTVRLQLAPRKLIAVYLAAHSGGSWVSGNDVEKSGSAPVVYASRNGHAAYEGEGDNGSNSTTIDLGLGKLSFELLNTTQKGSKSIDCRKSYSIVAADFLGEQITAPAWLSYTRRWGPHIVYDRSWILETIRACLGAASLGDADEKAAAAIMDALPDEFKEENGPTGPKKKGSWSGRE